MPQIDPVVVELRADLGKYRAEMKEAARTAQQSLGRQEKQIKSLEMQMRRSSSQISGTLKKLGGAFATYFGARELMELSDSFTRFQNQLKVAGLEGERLADIQERLRAIGSQYGTDLEALASIFNRASLAQKELGASTDQIIRLNEIVSAGLKITGTSAVEAKGALLQLSQALGSGVVRAEEFNSILEGALPIAQAAARGIDGYGGSVSKLRSAVVEGKITSKEFFDGVLKGGVQTIKQAEAANLTLGNSFQVLRNELMLYFGEASKSNGATAALSAAIAGLARNLDVIIPALAVVATALGVGVVTNAIAARLATAALGATAVATGRALLVAFGGPVGLAITATAVAIGYIASEADEAAVATGKAADVQARSNKLHDDARPILERLATATGGARTEALKLARAKLEEAKATRDAAAATAFDLQVKARAARAEAEASVSGFGGQGSALGRVAGFLGIGAAGEASQAQINADAAWQAYQRAGADVAALTAAMNAPAPTPSGAGASDGKAKRGRDAARDEAAYQNELAQLRLDELRARADLSGAAEARYRVAMAELDAEREAFKRSIDLDDGLNKAQRETLLAEKDKALEARRDVIEQERNRALIEQEAALRESDLEAMRDEAVIRADMADNMRDRQRIELDIFDIAERLREAELRRVMAVEDSASIAYQQAADDLAFAEQTRAMRREAVRRANMTARERYTDYLNRSSEAIAEDVDEIAISGLEKLNDELANSIDLTGILGDKFGSVANQIINDLLRIAIQQAVIKPLAESLFGSGGGGGVLGAIGSIAGAINGGTATKSSVKNRAGGGYVEAGQLYRVNEAGNSNLVEGFRPASSGEIIPLGQMNAKREGGGAGNGVVTVKLELSGDVDAKIAEVSTGVAVEVVRASAGPISDLAAKKVGKSISRGRL